MATSPEEQEQIEALKQWWDSYGRPVILGGIIGLAVLVGYQWYSTDQARKAQAASALFESLDKEPNGAARLREEFPSTPYAALAALGAAKTAVLEGDTERAETEYRWVLASATSPELKELARLNLGKLLLDQDNAADALSLTEARPGGHYEASFQELTGDIHHRLGDRNAAVSAYEAAVGRTQSAEIKSIIRLKIDDLGADS